MANRQAPAPSQGRPQAAPPATKAPSTVAPARTAAAHVLLAVERGIAHSDDQLRSQRVEVLSRQDRDLATELVRGVLRWQLVLDREIAARLRYPESDMHYGVIIALRLGAYQLLFLDRIPSHAAVNDSVELAKQADGQEMGNLVNAVLRRLLREKAELHGLRTEATAAYPPWLVTRWTSRFGLEATRQLCAFGQQAPPATIRLLQGGVDPAREEESERAAAADGVTEATSSTLEPGAFLKDVRRVVKGDPAAVSTPSRIQDEASQLVAELAAWHAGSTLLDACAAPGGKTAILAERNPDAELTAIDVSSARLRIMQRRLPWSEHVHFLSADATTLAPDTTYSTILCDAPCSGTGTLARNPEIRHRLNAAALVRHGDRQLALLRSCLGALRPGGRLVYSTCSLEPEENEQVVEAALLAVPGARVLPVEPVLGELLAAGILTPAGHARLIESALAGPYLRTIPGVHPCDGFFAALLTVG